MKVVVTGACGYIGSTLVPMLVEAGHEVVAIDNLMYHQRIPWTSLVFKAITFSHDDVRSASMMGHYLDADVVIPLAALVGAKACERDPDAAIEINHGAIGTLMSIMKPEQHVIYPNTNSGYGTGAEGTSKCTEETPLTPISHYGETKCFAEYDILKADRGDTVLRLATVFGVSPRMRLDLLVNDFVHRACRDGFLALYEPHFMRNFIHVTDVCYAIMHAMDTGIGGVYNVGLSDANISKLELAEIIADYVDIGIVEIDGQDQDKRNYIVSNQKIEDTGWKPGTSLREGILELVVAYPFLKDQEMRNA